MGESVEDEIVFFPEDSCCTGVPEKNIIYNICYGQAVYERNLAPPVLFKH